MLTMVQTPLNKLPGSFSNSFPTAMSQWSTITMSLCAEINRVCDSYQLTNFMKTEGIRLTYLHLLTHARTHTMHTHTHTNAQPKDDLEVLF